MFTIPRGFTLVEQGSQFGSDSFQPQHYLQGRKFIEITAGSTTNGKPLVKEMIQAIIDGQTANIPVIFNRTQQEINLDELPEHLDRKSVV